MNNLFNTPPTVEELIKLIDSFYPKTTDNNINHVMIDVIVEEKIKELQSLNKTLPVKNLLNTLKKAFKAFDIMDERHLQFPSYSISIRLKSIKIEHVSIDSFLRIKISLLEKYFVVFYEDINSFENLSRFRPLFFRVITSQNKNMDPDKDIWNSVIKTIQYCFPTYKIINHSLLFSNKIKGVIYKSEKPELYSLYEFLFDNEYKWGNIEIAI